MATKILETTNINTLSERKQVYVVESHPGNIGYILTFLNDIRIDESDIVALHISFATPNEYAEIWVQRGDSKILERVL